MGTQVIAVCEYGVKSKIALGSGRRSYKLPEYSPGFWKDCKDVKQMNLRDEFPVCMSCIKNITIPYNNPQFIGSIGDKIVTQSFDNALTNGTYRCTNFKIMTLRFSRGHMFWD